MADGLPNPTEAECKPTTHRVKNCGCRWNTDNAEAMMALAALHDSRLWHQRWASLDPQRNLATRRVDIDWPIQVASWEESPSTW